MHQDFSTYLRKKSLNLGITKRGKPIAKLVYFARQNEKDPLLGSMEGLVETIGDLTEPVIDSDA